MREAVDGCAAVAHLAAVASVTRSLEDPVGTGSVTHGGTVNVAALGRGRGGPPVRPGLQLRGVRRRGGAARRRDGPAASAEPLRGAKLAAEEVCAAAADAGQLDAVLPALLQRVRPPAGPRLASTRA